MAKKAYIGVQGVASAVAAMYIGVNSMTYTFIDRHEDVQIDLDTNARVYFWSGSSDPVKSPVSLRTYETYELDFLLSGNGIKQGYFCLPEEFNNMYDLGSGEVASNLIKGINLTSGWSYGSWDLELGNINIDNTFQVVFEGVTYGGLRWTKLGNTDIYNLGRTLTGGASCPFTFSYPATVDADGNLTPVGNQKPSIQIEQSLYPNVDTSAIELWDEVELSKPLEGGLNVYKCTSFNNSREPVILSCNLYNLRAERKEVARKVKKAYVGDSNDIAQQFWPPTTGGDS